MNNKYKQPNPQESSQPSFAEKHPGIRKAAQSALAGLSLSIVAGTGIGAALEHPSNDAPRAEAAAPVAQEESHVITNELALKIGDIERQIDHPTDPTDVAAFDWNQANLPGFDRASITFKVDGRGIVASGEERYGDTTHHALSPDLHDSLEVAARNYEAKLGEQVQAGEELVLTGVEIAGDASERVVVTKIDPSPEQ
jgi:hypothetical protein